LTPDSFTTISKLCGKTNPVNKPSSTAAVNFDIGALRSRFKQTVRQRSEGMKIQSAQIQRHG